LSFDFPMTIQEGAMRRVAPGLKARYEIKGRVRRDGSFSWGWGHATGQLAEPTGTGQWGTTAGATSRNCSGGVALQRQQKVVVWNAGPSIVTQGTSPMATSSR